MGGGGHGRRPPHHRQGRAVQAVPVQPILKPTGTKRWKLEYDEMLSSFAFRFNLRRYTKVTLAIAFQRELAILKRRISAAGAYTRPLFSST